MPITKYTAEALKRIFSQSGSDNTPEGGIVRAGGKHETKTITLSANNTSASVNVFQVTGPVNIKSLHGEVLVATTLTNCTDVYFDLWDGTTSVPLTKTTTAALSGAGVGSFFIKTDIASVALTTLLNSQGRLSEISGNKVSQEFHTTPKIGVSTYIRFNYTTTDAPINAQLKIDCTWSDVNSGDVVAV